MESERANEIWERDTHNIGLPREIDKIRRRQIEEKTGKVREGDGHYKMH